MKQITQNYKTGQLELIDVPVPLCGVGRVLVENKNSLVSIGTEKLIMDLARKSLLGKAKERPDLVRQVINKVKTDGLMEAFRQAMARLEEAIPLGYSSAGVVKEVGKNVSEFRVGDRVACVGFGTASHAEVIAVPKNLCIEIPEDVSFQEASFVALGAIALHSIRVSEARIGENIVVIGLGLLGQITIQILKAAGCNVLGTDVDPQKLKIAKSFGIDEVTIPENIAGKTKEFTKGNGADAVIIFASTKSNQPMEQAAQIARDRAKIIASGMIGLTLPRKIFYEKELKLIISRALGPGIYDEQYEKKGIDYPFSYVRWTEKRNMEAFLNLVKEKKVKLQSLITHQFKIKDALSAYKMVLEGKEKYIGVVLEYPDTKEKFEKKIIFQKESGGIKKDKINVGLIGAGLHSKGVILPVIKQISGINLLAIAAAEGLNATALAKKFGFKYCTTNYERILNDGEIDAVIIVTPHNLHAKMLKESLEAGKDVFLEKPLALNEAELKEIIEVYNKKPSRIMVGFNRRYSPFSVLAKELLHWHQGPYIINCRVNVGYIPKDHWVHDLELGGGNIIGEVCHFVDLIQFFTGSSPVEVYAKTISGEVREHIPDDNLVINLKMQDGSVASIVYTALGTKIYPREKIEIFGGGAVAAIDNFKSLVYVQQGKKKNKSSFNMDKGYRNEFLQFFEAIRQGKEMPVKFEDYLFTTLATFKIMESIQKGVPQAIDLSELSSV